MYRKELNAASPLRVLDNLTHGGLEAGSLGLILAEAGIGKTACLVQIGLDDLLRKRKVLHIALDQSAEHVRSWYDTLFEELAEHSELTDIERARQLISDNRIIQAYTDRALWPERLRRTVALFERHASFHPDVILVDGYPWVPHKTAENAATIGAFKTFAALAGAELWMTATSEGIVPLEGGLSGHWREYAGLVDVAIALVPEGETVALRILDDGDSDMQLELLPTPFRLRKGQEDPHSKAERRRTLHSNY